LKNIFVEDFIRSEESLQLIRKNEK